MKTSTVRNKSKISKSPRKRTSKVNTPDKSNEENNVGIENDGKILLNKNFKVKDFSKIIKTSSIDSELISHGYNILNKIIIDNNGQKQTLYIKCINEFGQKVFVYIDSDGYTTSKANDFTLKQTSTSNFIPHSLRIGAYNCANNQVCGVAFLCPQNSVCVIKRDKDDIEPIENNFVFKTEETEGDKIASTEIDGIITAYPVVRLSEIKTNNLQVLKNTDLVTRRLRNSIHKSLIIDIENTRSSLNDLDAEFERFIENKQLIEQKLPQVLENLNSWNLSYIKNPPTKDSEREKFEHIKNNLAIKNENAETLFNLLQKIASLKIDIDKIVDNINNVNQLMESNLSTIENAVFE